MFGRNRRLEAAKERERIRAEERYRQLQTDGAELFRRMAELRNLDRAELPHEALRLLQDAKHQVELIRQSIADRTRYKFRTNGELAEGDLATSLAEDIGQVMRDNVTSPQTFLEAMTDQLPDVHFTVTWYDAVAMTAAELRLERIAGVVRGLELAGLVQRDWPKPP